MAFDPISLAIGGLAAGAMFASSKSSSPSIPAANNSTTTIYQQVPQVPIAPLPDPTPPPRSSLSPIDTASSERARAAQGGATGNSDIVLTNSSQRNQNASSVSRTTLLGQ